MNNNTSNPEKNIESNQIFAFFDFDGTLIKKESFALFLLFAVGYLKVFLNIIPLIYSYMLYKLNIISNGMAKEKAITILLKGNLNSSLDVIAKEFAKKKLDRLINPHVYSRLEYHLEHNHTIIIVSANLEIYLIYWAKMHNINEVLATTIEFKNNICTGKLVGINCYGKQKVKKITEFLNKNNLKINYSYAYGNSKGDYEMLLYANEAYWYNGKSLIPWSKYKNERKNK